jgi:hypothetical protein
LNLSKKLAPGAPFPPASSLSYALASRWYAFGSSLSARSRVSGSPRLRAWTHYESRFHAFCAVVLARRGHRQGLHLSAGRIVLHVDSPASVMGGPRPGGAYSSRSSLGARRFEVFGLPCRGVSDQRSGAAGLSGARFWAADCSGAVETGSGAGSLSRSRSLSLSLSLSLDGAPSPSARLDASEDGKGD